MKNYQLSLITWSVKNLKGKIQIAFFRFQNLWINVDEIAHRLKRKKEMNPKKVIILMGTLH
jgi:hypothetical protein